LAFKNDAYLYLVDQAEGLTDEQRIELGQLAELPDPQAFWTRDAVVEQLPDRITHPAIAAQPFQGMNDFESERAAKAARFRQLAEKHARIATGRHFAARERLELIPLGQPILLGHHSEKRHRRDLNRIDEHFAKAKEHHDKAEYVRRRATAAESNVIIFSDDPDATEKLVDKIERLKNVRA
jgi:hypothetical protein